MLVIVKEGSEPGKDEKRVKVGKGSVVRLGHEAFEVVDVVYDEDGEGAVKVRPIEQH